EVYELFQSAWSGAEYQPDKADQGIEDHTIYAINALGQYDILNEDLSGLEDADDIRQVPSELGAIVTNIRDMVDDLHIKPLPQPWLPPLKKAIYVQDLRTEDFKVLWQKSHQGSLSAIFGMVDLPSQQAQEVISHDFDKDGNLVLYSAPGMGKSTFLQTLVMDLARQNTPDLMHFYLFDFGTNGLLPLRSLPHVADSFMMEDSEKLTKFMLRMQEEVALRKKLFSRYGVSNIGLYRQMSGEGLPQIIIVIDSYDGIKEAELGEQLEATFQTLLRDGTGLGINVVMTAGRMGALKSALQANLKTRLALKMTDDNDVRTLIGRHDYILEDIPGRGLMKLEQPEAFQIIQAIQEEAEDMDAAWSGDRPKAIPIVPEKLTMEDFMAKASVQEAIGNGELPLGLDVMRVESVSIPMEGFKHLAYISDNEESLQTVTRQLLMVSHELMPNLKVMLLDSERNFSDYASTVQTYIQDGAVFEDMTEQLVYEMEQRQKGKTKEDWLVIIPNLESYLSIAKEKINLWDALLKQAHQVGLHLIVGGRLAYLGISSNALPKMIREKVQYFLLGMRLSDQNFLDKVYNSREIHPAVDEVYLHDRKQSVKLKLVNKEIMNDSK
uniref:FtsK/SpoIIIE domain-containing protein n=1 Tax=Streptococcus caballi TaxID=439220 RepID=UPI00036FE656